MFSCFKGKQRALFDDPGVWSEKQPCFGEPVKGMSPLDTTERLAALRATITDSKVDCYVIPRFVVDPHRLPFSAESSRGIPVKMRMVPSMSLRKTVGRNISGMKQG